MFLDIFCFGLVISFTASLLASRCMLIIDNFCVDSFFKLLSRFSDLRKIFGESLSQLETESSSLKLLPNRSSESSTFSSMIEFPVFTLLIYDVCL